MAQVSAFDLVGLMRPEFFEGERDSAVVLYVLDEALPRTMG
jgi:hypothetical protein